MKYIVGVCVIGIVCAFCAFVIRGLVRVVRQYKDIRTRRRLSSSNHGEGSRESDPVEISKKEDIDL